MRYTAKEIENKECCKKFIDHFNDLEKKIIEKNKNFQQESLTDISIDKNALDAECINNISKYHKYVTIWSEQKINLSNLQNSLNSIEKDLYDYYKFNYDSSSKMTETSINKYILGNDMFISINSVVNIQKIFVENIEFIVKNFNNRGYALNNLIELKKIELGLIK